MTCKEITLRQFKKTLPKSYNFLGYIVFLAIKNTEEFLFKYDKNSIIWSPHPSKAMIFPSLNAVQKIISSRKPEAIPCFLFSNNHQYAVGKIYHE